MDLTLPSGTPATAELVDDAARGLVIVPDLWGLRPLFADMCRDLSRRTGWSVVAVEPFPGQDLPGAEAADGFDARSVALRSTYDDRLLADAVAAAEVTGCERVGLIGFCMGGMYALKGASVGRFDRVAGFYGMIRVPEAWSGPGQGHALHAVDGRPHHVEVMAVVGGVDAWTPPDDVEALEAAGATVLRYADADHGFVHDATRPAHRADDAADAWARVLDFLAGG